MSNLLLESKGFNIFGLDIKFYALFTALGMVFGIIFAILICKKKGYDKNMPIDLGLFALPSAIIGARLYYCIFNGVESFSEIFAINKGGMAIYGGVIGGFLGVLLCCKIKKYSLLHACDIVAPCLILGQAIGRIGCYFAGCCYGVETTIESLKIFPISTIQDYDGKWHYATFFYESLLDFLGFIFLMFLTFKNNKRGVITAGYLITYGTIRVILEQFRDQAESLMLGNTDIKVSQLLSLMLVIFGILLLILINRKSTEARKWVILKL